MRLFLEVIKVLLDLGSYIFLLQSLRNEGDRGVVKIDLSLRRDAQGGLLDPNFLWKNLREEFQIFPIPNFPTRHPAMYLFSTASSL